jgi:hypothetical protein
MTRVASVHPRGGESCLRVIIGTASPLRATGAEEEEVTLETMRDL